MGTILVVDDALVRWARLLLAATAFGGLAVALLVERRSITGRRQLLRMAFAGAVGAGVLTLAPPVLSDGPDALTGMRGDRLAMLETALLLALGCLALRASGRHGRRAPLLLAVPVALAISVTEPLRGHAGALPGWTPVLAPAAHVLAALTWLGMLPALVVLLLPASGRGQALRGTTVGFARLAGGSLVLLVATGLIGAGHELATPGDLLGTGYGRLVLVKIGLVAGVALAALHNDALLFRSRAAGRWIAVEAFLGVAALAATAVLGESAPAPAAPMPDHRLATYTAPLALLTLVSGAGMVGVVTTRRGRRARP